MGLLLETAGDRVTFRIGPGQLHGYLSLEQQNRVINYLEEWIQSL